MSGGHVLPSSISPHLCVLPSDDLVEFLVSSGLPPLHQLLQSFSPLTQVTTRTSTYQSIPHQSFALRFSDLSIIEDACKEDEESRAGRTIDWIGSQISKKAETWVAEVHRRGESNYARLPWWEEVRRCVEGDWIPNRSEGWNHPVAIIRAVSTQSANPLQTITNLQSRPVDLPAWVDQSILQFILIVHSPTSTLSIEESTALFNAVKKQYGVHTHLMNLELSGDALPTPIAPPNLSIPPPISANQKPVPELPRVNVLRLSQHDLTEVGRFVRELVIMSLLPWMEHCVVHWNEAFSSTRRLPSRLFSSTKRLFGGSGASTPQTPKSPSTSSFTSNGHANETPPQQRRLAEFATFLGDFKLAISVWEALRKEGGGGSEILPLLLAPSPAIPAHASYALHSLAGPDPPASAQLRSLLYAVRWEIGVSQFHSRELEGERWLIWAAGQADEPPAALLFAHAALLCERRGRGTTRRAALWYALAARKLEKCGIKPLTIYFLQKSLDLYNRPPRLELSPLFSEAEFLGKQKALAFDAITRSIESSLGRLKYTTGDSLEAAKLFLGLLKESPRLAMDPAEEDNESDKLALENFRNALEHLSSTSIVDSISSELALSFQFSRPRETRLRYAEMDSGGNESWDDLYDDWRIFWKQSGSERLEESKNVRVGEKLWLDISLYNPLNAVVTLSQIALEIEEDGELVDQTVIESNVVDGIRLSPFEKSVLSVELIVKRPARLQISRLTYVLLERFTCTENLSYRGRRLNDTIPQMRTISYAPDVTLRLQSEDSNQSLVAVNTSGASPVIFEGECRSISVRLQNQGEEPIDEIWVLHDSDHVASLQDDEPIEAENYPVHSRLRNDIQSASPQKISLAKLIPTPSLSPKQEITVPFQLHAEEPGFKSLRLLFVYRKGGFNFRFTRTVYNFTVSPSLRLSVQSYPAASHDIRYGLNIELENLTSSAEISIMGASLISATWQCQPSTSMLLPIEISPLQRSRILMEAEFWKEGIRNEAVADYVARKVEALFYNQTIEATFPPETDLLHSVPHQASPSVSQISSNIKSLWQLRSRVNARQRTLTEYPHIPASTLPCIFPAIHPHAVQILVLWEQTSDKRVGFLLSDPILLGALHGGLSDIVEDVDDGKLDMGIYAETQREKRQFLNAVRSSPWNAEMDPVDVSLRFPSHTEHDFVQGPCHISVDFQLRNFSPTNPVRYCVRLPKTSYEPNATSLSPHFMGLLTRRGTIPPLESTHIPAKLWVPGPATYDVTGWTLEVEVDGPLPQTSRQPTRNRRCRYSQTSYQHTNTLSVSQHIS
ncbi:hypothetical protein SISNIDRAFT_451603 [Sistotremastrum niveocremeum HHB9708]|uniref:Uncharacterized protein n=2 Tax=Sistotremastraceae TaxID=3402574 RepID=A0A164XGB9_9AGAM|nr:hypothetical protein SISNIDRAFT_451603 [Sistotremastrum niveocremeum HHB9708]KZT41327.1 hypothetical protein SISSUDRAFT_1042908 [Sistotremastrum suecicum HHB10207 ss-3]